MPPSPSPPGALLRARTSLGVGALLTVLGVVSTAWSPAAAGATAWRWPLQPRPAVLSRFAPPAQPWDPGRRGVELAAAVDQSVRAPAAGAIVFAGVVAGIPTVTVDHGDLISTYQPVRTTALRGTVVAAGATFGTVAALPRLCGAATCLRWGVYVDGSSPRRYADPLALVGATPIRLLPPAAAGELSVAVGPGSDRRGAATTARAAATVSAIPGSAAPRRLDTLSSTATAVTLVAGAGLALPAAAALVGSVTGRRRARGRRRAGVARQDR